MFIAVFIAILVFYILIVFFIGRSGWRWFKLLFNPSRTFKWLYGVTVAVVSTSFILGRFFDNVLLDVIGAYWMAVFYLLIILLPLMYVVSLLFRLTALPREQVSRWAGFVTLFLLFGLIAYGSYYAYSPVVTSYSVHIAKEAPGMQKLRIAMVADMHFGVLSGRAHAERMVKGINELQPDLVLMPGDIFDDSIEPYVDQGIDKLMTGIQAPFGVYASLGNHDGGYTGRVNELIQVVEDSHIHLLYDERTVVANSIELIGRKDRSDHKRKELSALMNEVDTSKPVILLEHQPYDLDIAKDLGVDLMLSGHTHRGQVAPFVTKLIYENDYGLLQKGSYTSIVTSGFGFWGPPIRLGSRSEIVLIEVTFD